MTSSLDPGVALARVQAVDLANTQEAGVSREQVQPRPGSRPSAPVSGPRPFTGVREPRRPRRRAGPAARPPGAGGEADAGHTRAPGPARETQASLGTRSEETSSVQFSP